MPPVAVNDVCFLTENDYEAHEARVCVLRGQILNDDKRTRLHSRFQYMRDIEEMRALFRDIPEALDNTVAIARRCNLTLNFDQAQLPDFPCPDEVKQDELLHRNARQGLSAIIKSSASSAAVDEQRYAERIEHELDVITKMGYAGYFLIVADFIRWAKENDIAVGPGRGSGGGSLVAYALGITTLDPIRYDLLFERFLNPERVSLPDFDIDFCMDRRDEVIEYVSVKYGRDRVAQIVTHGTMNARAVIRDVGRILGMPYSFGDRLARQIVGDPGITLKGAMEEADNLREEYEKDDEVRTAMDLAMRLEGSVRNPGRHAGGLVITPKPLVHYMPLYGDSETGGLIGQFDMKDMEAIGLVKFDFLGLKTLTIIGRCLEAVNQRRQREGRPPLDTESIPLEPKNGPTYRLIQTGATSAVFQLESNAMRRLIKQMEPSDFNDLVALVALMRPGPLKSGMAAEYIDRKHGRKPVIYEHPALESILSPTWGVIVYQEQVMSIARDLADYTLGKADLLRHAMGKKKADEMAEHRDIFINNAVKKGIKKTVAEGIFSTIEKFAGYGFNKSHSVAYALIAYRTAWLKTHYPTEFMAAVLSAEHDNIDRVVDLCFGLTDMKLKLSAPDVNLSHAEFQSEGTDSVRYGLAAIRGVGRSAAQEVRQQRDAGGPFKDMRDLCQRVDAQKLPRRALQNLILAGAMDCFGQDRAVLLDDLDAVIRLTGQVTEAHRSGQFDMFGFDNAVDDNDSAETKRTTGELQRLTGERQTLGQYISGHPMHFHWRELSGSLCTPLKSVSVESSDVYVAGIISRILQKRSQRGVYGELLLEHGADRLTVLFYSEAWQKYRELSQEGELLIVHGSPRTDRLYNETVLSAAEAFTLSQWRNRYGILCLDLGDEVDIQKQITQLAQLLPGYRHQDGRPVRVEYHNQGVVVHLKFDADWLVRIEDDLLEKLNQVLGEHKVQIMYQRKMSKAPKQRPPATASRQSRVSAETAASVSINAENHYGG